MWDQIPGPWALEQQQQNKEGKVPKINLSGFKVFIKYHCVPGVLQGAMENDKQDGPGPWLWKFCFIVVK